MIFSEKTQLNVFVLLNILSGVSLFVETPSHSFHDVLIVYPPLSEYTQKLPISHDEPCRDMLDTILPN